MMVRVFVAPKQSDSANTARDTHPYRNLKPLSNRSHHELTVDGAPTKQMCLKTTIKTIESHSHQEPLHTDELGKLWMTRAERMLPTTSIARHSRVYSSITVRYQRTFSRHEVLSRCHPTTQLVAVRELQVRTASACVFEGFSNAHECRQNYDQC
jgi:hypothetical protein